ncbi:serine-rich adhesin for platelets isoform X2 [Penaeus vannamei]
MGSSCLIKTCTVKKAKVGASFHRLPWKYPSLFRTLQRVFGENNVRELTRWSRICSLHIGQLAPLAATDEVVQRLMEYYAWNARSYKRLFELSKQKEELGEKEGSLQDGPPALLKDGAEEGPVVGSHWTLEDLISSGLLAMSRAKDRMALVEDGEDAAGADGRSVVSSNRSEASAHSEDEFVDVDGPAEQVSRAPPALTAAGDESGHDVNQYLLHMIARSLAAPEENGDRSMIPDDSAAGAMDAARDPDVGMDESLKKTGCQDNSKKTGCQDNPGKTGSEEEQDINDNHTKLGDSDALANGEVQSKEREEVKDNNKEVSEESSNRKDEGVEESDNKMDTEEADDSQVDVEGSEDEGKESSEDDEDKLVISEGNERGTEESNDENSKGETPLAPQKAPSRSPTPQRSEKRPAEDEAAVGVPKKRQRSLDEMVSLDSFSTVSQVEGSLGQVKRDLEAIEFLLKQKEEEWNTLLRLQKRKEELYLRLVRKRQVLLMKSGQEEKEEEQEGKTDEEGSGEGSGNLLFLPQGGYSSLGGPQLPLMMMSQLLSGSQSPQSLQVLPQVVTTKEGSRSNSNNGNGNISVIDIHTSSNKPGGEVPRISMSSEAHNKLSKQLTSGLSLMKPILPKPSGPQGSLSNIPAALSTTPTGQGPQGPTINVQQLIAAHRKENPNTPPIRRATRGAWRHRYDGDKRSSREQDRPPSVSSSSSEAEMRTSASAKGMLAMSDPSVSYKDVLLRFAELTQIEKQPGSPQISIFPVGSSESSTRKSEGSRESTPIAREQTPTSVPPTATLPTSKPSLEGPSALAKLLLGSQAGVTSGGNVKMVGDATTNSQYLTLSALLSGGSTTTVKEKSSHSQSESRSKKSSHHSEEGGGNPKCQGCHKQRAQFVCAGCGNQWYCSRECQVAAWEEHSEHCSN